MTGEPNERYMFVFTDLVNNNNKDYLYEVWDNGNGTFTVMGKYGRIGQSRSTKGWPKTLTRKELNKILHDREHKDFYDPVSLHVPTIVQAPQASTIVPVASQQGIHPKVASIIDIIFAEANEYVKTYIAAAVESLSQDQIQLGRKLLKEAQDLYLQLKNQGRNIVDAALINLVQKYYRAVPTQLPHRIDVNDLTRRFVQEFDEQEQRLDQLEAAIATIVATNANPLQSNMAKLGANVSLVDPSSKAYSELSTYALSTHVHSHFAKIRIKDIYEIEIPVERQAYNANTRGKHHNELLFHGTATQNVRHILRTGLICPAVASSGRMFGNGVYFANKSSKSTQYCSRRGYNSPHMLFIAQVDLGNMYVAPHADSSYRSAPAGYDSVWGKANVTGGSWSSSSGKLQYDEFIVYHTNQQTIRYLITFDK